MTEPTTGEQKPTEKMDSASELSKAVRIVQRAIKTERDRLQQIAESQEDGTISLIGETIEQYDAHVLAQTPP